MHHRRLRQPRICRDSPSWRHNLPNLIPLWAFMINGVTAVWQSAAVAFGFDCQKRARREKKKIHPRQTSRPRRFCFPPPPKIFAVPKRHKAALSSPHAACRVASENAPSFQTLPFIFAKLVGSFYNAVHKRRWMFCVFYELAARQVLTLIPRCNFPDASPLI